MENFKNVMYAGLGLAKQTNDQVKEKFDTLVEKGKKADVEGKNVVGDLFKIIDEGKDKVHEKFEEVESFIKGLKSEKK